MPTPTGLPKKGERVKYQQVIFGEKGKARYGTVVDRTPGEYWTLYVRWDEELPGDRSKWAYGQPGVTMMVDAAYALSQGWLVVIG